MKALIIDDERLARSEVRRLLSEFSWISVIGEAENVDEALTKINELQPDLLFLDVQMPGKTGFVRLDHRRSAIPRSAVPITSWSATVLVVGSYHFTGSGCWNQMETTPEFISTLQNPSFTDR